MTNSKFLLWFAWTMESYLCSIYEKTYCCCCSNYQYLFIDYGLVCNCILWSFNITVHSVRLDSFLIKSFKSIFVYERLESSYGKWLESSYGKWLESSCVCSAFD